jgi:hypothetical protein
MKAACCEFRGDLGSAKVYAAAATGEPQPTDDQELLIRACGDDFLRPDKLAGDFVTVLVSAD